MKCVELADALERLEKIFQADTERPQEPFIELKRLLNVVPELSVSQLSKKLSKLTGTDSAPGSISVGQIAPLCEGLVSLLSLVGKPAVVKEVRELGASIVRLNKISPDDLVAKPSTTSRQVGNSQNAGLKYDLIQMHLRLLEQSLGDDVGFASAYRSLETDTGLGTKEFVALAKQFTFASTKTKSAALKKIWARHQALMTSRAKAAATAGRIAG